MSTIREYSIRDPRTIAVSPAGRSGARARLRALTDTIAAAFLRARSRARLRRDLERLDDWQLHDIGIPRETLEAEARKPFWRR